MPLALCTICTRHNHVLAQTNNNAGKNCGIVMHMNIVLFLTRRWFLNSSHAQHMDCNGLQTQMAHVSIYLLLWAALTSLTNLFCYFCGCFCYQEMLLVMNFWWQKCFTGNIEAICTISFKIRAKSRSKNPFQWAEEFAPVAVYVLEDPFSLASCHQNLAFYSTQK